MLIPAAFASTINGRPVFIVCRGNFWSICDDIAGKAWWLSGRGWCFFNPERPAEIESEHKREELLTLKFPTADLADAFLREYESRYPVTREEVVELMPLCQHNDWTLDPEETIAWLLAHPSHVHFLRKLIHQVGLPATVEGEPEDETESEREPAGLYFCVDFDEGRKVLVVYAPRGCDEQFYELFAGDGSARPGFRRHR